LAYVITEPCIGTKDNSCVEVCPVDAIYPEDQVPHDFKKYIEINAAHFLRDRG
jgi:NAD-dependent dihydropyrimidine dehydrogenase PreA subunit